jgi:thioredoxin 1
VTRQPGRRPESAAAPRRFIVTTTNEGGTVGQATKTVTDASFADDVLTSDKPVLVDFWAEWCGPCRLVSPVLEEIAAEHSEKISVVKLNIDENPQTARDYQVMSIPTMSVFSGGKVVKSIIGARPKSAILADLADYL